MTTKRPWRVTGNSSVYRFELGAHPDVLEYFQGHLDEIRQQFRNEQAYLSDVPAPGKGSCTTGLGVVPQLQVPLHPRPGRPIIGSRLLSRRVRAL